VISAGVGATRFKPGDAVYARASRDTIGTFAEQIALPEKFIALKPATISHAVDAFKVVRRGGVVISLSGPPLLNFAAEIGAGHLIRFAIWLMGRKVYARAPGPVRPMTGR